MQEICNGFCLMNSYVDEVKSEEYLWSLWGPYYFKLLKIL